MEKTLEQLTQEYATEKDLVMAEKLHKALTKPYKQRPMTIINLKHKTMKETECLKFNKKFSENCDKLTTAAAELAKLYNKKAYKITITMQDETKNVILVPKQLI